MASLAFSCDRRIKMEQSNNNYSGNMVKYEVCLKRNRTVLIIILLQLKIQNDNISPSN